MLLRPCILAAIIMAGDPNLENLNFASNNLEGWQGEGFTVIPSFIFDGGKGLAVRSGSPKEPQGQTALLHRTIVVPKGINLIRFRASAVRPAGVKPEKALDVVLMAPGRRVLPKNVRSKDGWVSTRGLRSGEVNSVHEYMWPVAGFEGQTLRIVVADEDDRPGCYVICSGFELAANDDFEEAEFTRFMLNLMKERNLPPVLRYTSQHFMALSNADETFTENRVKNCELMHTVFYEHFRQKGFVLQPPPGRLMLAIFDSQAGFEAYLGRQTPTMLTGLYHTLSNRFVMYDYGTNRAYLAQKQQAEQAGKRIETHVDRQIYRDNLERRAGDFRKDANIGTIMHEVSHQLSFNSGMLNREADLPLFLVEGLACYCEATSNGSWQGIGEYNPERATLLARTLSEGGKLLNLQEMIESDNWTRGKSDARTMLLGYAQSWALVRMLMEQQPQAMRMYLKQIYNRRTPDHRLTDFRQAFGSDLQVLEHRHQEYIRSVAQQGSAKK